MFKLKKLINKNFGNENKKTILKMKMRYKKLYEKNCDEPQ